MLLVKAGVGDYNFYLCIGQQPNKVEQEVPFGNSPSVPPNRSSGNDSKNPKSKLNELCQSMKFPSPKYYQSQTSENHLVVTVSTIIKEKEVKYSYTSKQVSSTKKYIKQCEESAAEKAYTALTELYGTSTSVMPPQHIQHYDERPGSCTATVLNVS